MQPQGSRQEKIEGSCLILAGGQGRRLTPDKPLLKVDGTPIIQRTAQVVAAVFDEVIIVTNTPDKYAFLGLACVPDEVPGCGPLMGLYSGLRAIKHAAAFVCAADMPFLDGGVIQALYKELPGYDIVVPYPHQRPEFLHAIYHQRCLPHIKEALDANRRRVQVLTQTCRTRRLEEDWFERRGLTERMDRALTNINTAEDYRRWSGQEPGKAAPRAGAAAGLEALRSLAPEVLREVRRTLIEQESVYQRQSDDGQYASLWAHSSRVGRIAHHLAGVEGLDREPALLAGLLHDTGKFVDGSYHEDDIPEERNALEFVQRILAGTAHEPWIPMVKQAILSMYLDDASTSDLGRVVHDADNLDKLGCMGVGQFFAKNALRRRFLDDELMVRASIELTYAYHASDTLKTAAGRALARERSARTRGFYTELMEEWSQLGLGAFDIVEEDIGGVVCILMVPRACSCGGELAMHSDILDALKCRSVVVQYPCARCGRQSEYSFCLPTVPGLPRKN